MLAVQGWLFSRANARSSSNWTAMRRAVGELMEKAGAGPIFVTNTSGETRIRSDDWPPDAIHAAESGASP